jgi:hypothetical protein
MVGCDGTLIYLVLRDGVRGQVRENVERYIYDNDQEDHDSNIPVENVRHFDYFFFFCQNIHPIFK